VRKDFIGIYEITTGPRRDSKSSGAQYEGDSCEPLEAFRPSQREENTNLVELKSQTPAGVVFLALLTFAKALWVVLVFLSFFGPFGPFGLLSLFLLLQGGIYVVVGRGLLHLKRWAYYVTLLMTLLIFVSLIIIYGGFNMPDTLENIVGAYFLLEFFPFVFIFGLAYGDSGVRMIITILIGFHVLIPAYLLQPRIRKVFGITRFLR